MSGGIIMKNKQIIYSKPNMANLHGAVGKSIMKTLREMPEPSMKNLYADANACKKRILARKTNDKK